MDTPHHPGEGLTLARTELDRAAKRLRRAVEDALTGGHYDDVEYDRLVVAYRRARHAAEAARRVSCGTERTEVECAAGSFTPTRPTSRLLFARYLYEHGHIAG